MKISSNWLSPLVYLSNNTISFLGVLLTTAGGVAWLFVLPVYLGEGGAGHPYVGILFFLVFPGVFFLGLLLIPLGMYLRFRKERHRGVYPSDFQHLNWHNPRLRRLVIFVGLATIANVIIGGHYTYAGVSYMDSTTFCGQTCHTVMSPEFTAYQDSPHFRVGCVECHIGEGASWFVRSKLSGTAQVFATVLNTYPRPIPTPIEDLRPARETCETCHWPAQFAGYRLRIWDKFAEDEQNTHSKTVLMMKIGGGRETGGIHGFHLAAGVSIEYISDPQRETIPWVQYTDSSGNVTEYSVEEWNPEQEGEWERRRMDCIDCHNRPTHTFDLPERAIDAALAEGRIDPSLPSVKRKGLEILKTEYASTAEAEQRIPAMLEEFYKNERPDVFHKRSEEVIAAARELMSIYQRNVFPEMNVTWGTYPNHIGHTDFTGCFRCHDELHSSQDGKTISQDCSSCHELLALEESDPEILMSLGISD